MKNKLYCYIAGFIDGKRNTVRAEGNVVKDSPFLNKLEDSFEIQYLTKWSNVTKELEQTRKETLQLLTSLHELEDGIKFLEWNMPTDLRKREQAFDRATQLQTEKGRVVSRLAEIDQQEETLEKSLKLYCTEIEKKAEIAEIAYIRGLSHGLKEYVHMDRKIKMPEYDMNSPVLQWRKQILKYAVEGGGI